MGVIVKEIKKFDSLIIMLTLLLILNVETHTIEKGSISFFYFTLIVIASYQIAIVNISRVNKILWRYASVREFIYFLRFVVAVIGVPVFLVSIFELWSISAILGFTTIEFIYFFSTRVGHRYYSLFKKSNNNHGKENALIIGAGEAGNLAYKNIISKNNYYKLNVLGYLDDASNKQGKLLNSVPIVGKIENLEFAVETLGVKTIVFAIPSMSDEDREEIINKSMKLGCQVKVANALVNSHDVTIKSFKISDLLFREDIIFSPEKYESKLADKVILVTGGGGSIGSELVTQCIKSNASKVIAFDNNENNVYHLEQNLIKEGISDSFTIRIGSVQDIDRLEELFNEFNIDIVFHAAAHKHVPLMEFSPKEAIKNNIIGTFNVANAAIKHDIDNFILVSTDKAVNPTNIMGASKRMAEIIIQNLNSRSRTVLSAVRFGNVLGSNGSVIPLFKNQIDNGGPVTVTHKDITRYFMTIEEASSLILESSLYAQGGDIFVLDMGEPIKIYDLAKRMIELSGFEPGKDIEIEVVGLRPGEKMYEELLINPESLNKTAGDKIFIETDSCFEFDLNKIRLDNIDELLSFMKNELINGNGAK